LEVNKARNGIQNIYPLAPMQMMMVYHAIKVDDPGNDAYFRQLILTIDGELDFDIFQKSVGYMVERYDILKTVFIYEKVKQPVQVVFKQKEVPVGFKDISGLTGSEKDRFIEDFTQQDKKKGFDLAKDSLLRITVIRWSEQKYRIVISNHHICMDGWCMGIVLADLFEIYEKISQNLPVILGKVYPYSQYINWLEKQDKLEAENYWNQYLMDYRQLAGVPSGKAEMTEAYLRKETGFRIDDATTAKLELLARNSGVTLSTIMLILWGFILQKYNQIDDVVFGTVVSGRSPALDGVDRMVGLFVNTVPIRIKCSDQVDFMQLAAEVQKAVGLADKYHYLPLPEMLAQTKLRQASLDHLLVYENYPAVGFLATPGFRVKKVEMLAEQSSYDLNIVIIPGAGLNIKITYNVHVYHPWVIETVKKHMGETAAKMALNAVGLFRDERFQQRLYDELWENVKNANLKAILDANPLFAEVDTVDEEGDFEFG
jgi:NRPS condensation-like uncharacterized protein